LKCNAQIESDCKQDIDALESKYKSAIVSRQNNLQEIQSTIEYWKRMLEQAKAHRYYYYYYSAAECEGQIKYWKSKYDDAYREAKEFVDTVVAAEIKKANGAAALRKSKVRTVYETILFMLTEKKPLTIEDITRRYDNAMSRDQ
jgi:hypothetical protein